MFLSVLQAYFGVSLPVSLMAVIFAKLSRTFLFFLEGQFFPLFFWNRNIAFRRFFERNKIQILIHIFSRLRHCMLSTFDPTANKIAQFYTRYRLTNQNHFLLFQLKKKSSLMNFPTLDPRALILYAWLATIRAALRILDPRPYT